MYVWKNSCLKLRITRLGAQYLIATGIVGALGVYTNNNLLYAVCSMMIGLFLVSGWVSWAILEAIEPDSIQDGTFFARMKGGLKLRLSDKKPKRVRHLGVYLNIPDCHAEPGFYLGGKGNMSGVAVFQIRPERRGWTKIIQIALVTSYPFGFLEKTRLFPVEMPLLAAPHPSGYDRPRGCSGDFSDPEPKSGNISPIGARPFIVGDSINKVHWKRTAQRGGPWVRIMEGGQPKGLLFDIDLAAWEPGADFEAELERISGAIFLARLQKTDVALAILGQHGRLEVSGHRAAWKALATLEAEKVPKGQSALS